MDVRIEKGQPVTGRHGTWYRHDTVYVDGKRLEGGLQVRRRYLGKRIGHRTEVSTFYRGAAVTGSQIQWLRSVQGEAMDNPMTPTTKGLLIVGGGVLLVGGAITAGVLLSKKSSTSTTTTTTTSSKPGAPGGKPTSRTTASWVPVSIDLTTATGIFLQPNATYALSLPGGDPNLPAVSAALPPGTTRSPAGNVAPTGFPADGRGTAAFRAVIHNGAKQVLMPASRNLLVWIQKIETITIEPIRA